jgi:ATP-dependent DNA ligase
LKGKGSRSNKTSLGRRKEEKIANLGKVGEGMTKIERAKTQNQKTKKQTNEKQRRRRESNPTHDPKFQGCRNNSKHSK